MAILTNKKKLCKAQRKRKFTKFTGGAFPSLQNLFKKTQFNVTDPKVLYRELFSLLIENPPKDNKPLLKKLNELEEQIPIKDIIEIQESFFDLKKYDTTKNKSILEYIEKTKKNSKLKNNADKIKAEKANELQFLFNSYKQMYQMLHDESINMDKTSLPDKLIDIRKQMLILDPKIDDKLVKIVANTVSRKSLGTHNSPPVVPPRLRRNDATAATTDYEIPVVNPNRRGSNNSNYEVVENQPSRPVRNARFNSSNPFANQNKLTRHSLSNPNPYVNTTEMKRLFSRKNKKSNRK